MARKIDTALAGATFHLPGLDPAELARPNPRPRGAVRAPVRPVRLAGDGIEPLSDEEIGITAIADVFEGNAPLWFYVLREGDVRAERRLGPVGGRIVAEVLLGLLKGDHFSYVNVEPNWTPTLSGGDFRMPDLVRFVQA